jgi:cell division protein FtsB
VIGIVLGRSVPRFILLAAAVVVGYLLFTTAGTALKSYRLAGDEQEARQQIAKLDSDYQELQAIRDYLSSDEYIESAARRMLGLVKPGETLVRVSSAEGEAQKPQGADQQPAGQSWWESLFGP